MSEKQKKRVLLIDDDTSLLVTLTDFLKFEGYAVTTAESGEAALFFDFDFESDVGVTS